MRTRAGSTGLAGLLLALAVGLMVAMPGCGGDDEGDKDDRTLRLCDVCTDDVDNDCFFSCIDFCLSEEDCETRCELQCDDCRRDFRCASCSANCTGTLMRCAPPDEPVTCDDGVYGPGAP